MAKSLNEKLELLLENGVATIKKEKIGNKKGEHSVIYINDIQYIYIYIIKKNQQKSWKRQLKRHIKKEEKRQKLRKKERVK